MCVCVYVCARVHVPVLKSETSEFNFRQGVSIKISGEETKLLCKSRVLLHSDSVEKPNSEIM